MTHTLSVFGLVLLTAATAAADDVRSIPLVLYPPAASSPPLKYPLLPELRDCDPRQRRDALPAGDQEHEAGRPAVSATGIRRWTNGWPSPLKDFPREEVAKFLKQCDTTFQEVDAGARSEDCDWGLTEELRKKGFATLLPDVQQMRAIAALLQLRIRYEIAEGRLDRAARSLQTGFAMSRHIADSPTVIGALVGIAIAMIVEKRLEEFIQQPDAPNLYWPLTDLPQPFIDLRKPMQGERVGLRHAFRA